VIAFNPKYVEGVRAALEAIDGCGEDTTSMLAGVYRYRGTNLRELRSQSWMAAIGGVNQDDLFIN